MTLAPSLKTTVPVGALPVTVAVNVTPIPTVDGLSELASTIDPASGAGGSIEIFVTYSPAQPSGVTGSSNSIETEMARLPLRKPSRSMPTAMTIELAGACGSMDWPVELSVSTIVTSFDVMLRPCRR